MNFWWSVFFSCFVASSAERFNVFWTAWPREPYAALEVKVGDEIEFEFWGGHNVAIHPSGSCDPADSIMLSSSALVYTIKEEDGPAITFACQIPNHCEQGGQILHVFVASDTNQCFSESNTVEVQGKGEVSITNLEIGDYVRSSSNSFSKVYSFGHLDSQAKVDYIRMSFDERLELEVSAKHMLWVNGGFARASSVRVGDMVDHSTVQAIQHVKGRGMYAPFTEDGTIVVGGVKSSCYSAVLRNSLFNQHTVIHGLLAPFRWWCQLGLCQQETYTNGISDRYRAFLRLPAMFQGAYVENMFSLMLAPLVGMAYTLDWASHNLVAVCAMIFLAKLWLRRSTKKQKLV